MTFNPAAAPESATLRYIAEDREELCVGLVVDQAPTGVAFLTTDPNPPAPGSVLNTQSRFGQPTAALVRRVVKLSGGLVLVAATFAQAA